MAPGRRGPRGVVIANDGLSCGGNLIQLGDTQERVSSVCGEPTGAKRWVLSSHGKTCIVDFWRYERNGWFPRLLRFENGVLVSLAAVSRS